MKKSKRLQTLVRLATLKEQKCAEILGNCQQRLDFENTKQLEVIEYGKEYQQRVMKIAKVGVNASTYQSYQNFISQLDIVAHQQTQQITKIEEELQQYKQQWQDAYNHSKVLKDLVARSLQNEALIEDKLEQKALDEMSQLSHRKVKR